MEELIKVIQELGKLSWMDYVQLVLTVVTIIISALALFYAIRVPKKIAEEQNRIALFEKRYEEVKRIGLMFTEFDRIKSKTESILFEVTSKKDTLRILNDCNKSLAIISENINGMYLLWYN
ncbi:MAG: hypothetical protein IJO14_10710 [Clostridia bacterium]|nr:hypothetical protein [Clostridia bacterium]